MVRWETGGQGVGMDGIGWYGNGEAGNRQLGRGSAGVEMGGWGCRLYCVLMGG